MPTKGGRPKSIALDGPAASGKSVVGRHLADALGYLYFDTGALYRALAVLALEAGVAAEDADGLADLLLREPVRVVRDEGPLGYRVAVGSRDISAHLRSAAVDAVVSRISAHRVVRRLLLDGQRRIAREQPVVMTGRDIGTVILPEADLKFYLDAPLAVRARRRLRERLAGGVATTYAAELAALAARDDTDKGRAEAPLAIAPDAVVVATEACDVAQVVAHLLTLVARWPDALTTRGGQAPCSPSVRTGPR